MLIRVFIKSRSQLLTLSIVNTSGKNPYADYGMPMVSVNQRHQKPKPARKPVHKPAPRPKKKPQKKKPAKKTAAPKLDFNINGDGEFVFLNVVCRRSGLELRNRLIPC